MAAEAQQVLAAALQAAEQVEAVDAASRAAAALAVERHHHDRAPALLDEPRGDDADHPRMPALAGQHVGVALAELGHLRFGLEADAALDLAPLVRWPRPARARSPSAALAVLGQQQLEAGVGAVQAPRGVQARRQGEADRALADPRRVDARDSHQRAQPRLGGRGQRAQPAPHERPVLAAQRHDVRHRRERDQVEIARQPRRVAPAGFEQRLRELVGDRRRAQLGARVAAQRRDARSAPTGSRPSARGEWWSVTTTAIPSSRAARTSSTAVIAQSAVTSSRVPRAASACTASRLQPVAGGAIGDEGVDVGAQLAQRAHQHRRRADPVDVVVAVDGDPRTRRGRARGSSRRLHRCRRSDRARAPRRPPGTRARRQRRRWPRRTSTCAIASETPQLAAQRHELRTAGTAGSRSARSARVSEGTLGQGRNGAARRAGQPDAARWAPEP